MLRETKKNIAESEIFVGISPKTLIYFYKDKVFQILKAILLEKKIIVYS